MPSYFRPKQRRPSANLVPADWPRKRSRLRRKDGQHQGDWRCLALEKFSSVERAEAVWQYTASSLRRPKCMAKIELEVTDQPAREPQ